MTTFGFLLPFLGIAQLPVTMPLPLPADTLATLALRRTATFRCPDAHFEARSLCVRGSSWFHAQSLLIHHPDHPPTGYRPGADQSPTGSRFAPTGSHPTPTGLGRTGVDQAHSR